MEQVAAKKIRIEAGKKASLKIAILGTRGIPNQYGGFEQFAEKFAARMAARGHEVYVYTSHNHPYKETSYENVQLIKCYDPEQKIGTAGQFIYDLNCIMDSRGRSYDVIFQLGYTSSTVWSWLMPGSSLLVTNMDGLEWKRTKYGKLTRWFLKHAERWGAKYSDQLIADSRGIKDYLHDKYRLPSTYVPYGADVYTPCDDDFNTLHQYQLNPGHYDLAIARFEPENNLEIILKAYSTVNAPQLVLIGNYNATGFGRSCYDQYRKHENIKFLGGVFDEQVLNELRYHSRLYLHGHSVGGTNPSLLEAMACHALIAAHDNVFNRSVLNGEAFYFNNADELTAIIYSADNKNKYKGWLTRNEQKIANDYNWDNITDKLENLFRQWVWINNQA